MYLQKLEVTVGRTCQSKEKIVLDLNEIPQPTAVYIPSIHEVILNNLACKALGMKENEAFDLATWRKINPYFEDYFKCVPNQDCIINRKVHVILFNCKHEIMNYSMKQIKRPEFGKILVIHFSKASEKYSVASISSLYSIKEEVAKLKPYLNRTGKMLHEATMKKYFSEETNQNLTLNDLVYYEKELRIIQKAFPSLSFREVVLCGLLVNDMESKDIASITNRTLDAVFVTIHRINKKLNFVNKKQLIDKLKELVSKTERNQSVVSKTNN